MFVYCACVSLPINIPFFRYTYCVNEEQSPFPPSILLLPKEYLIPLFFKNTYNSNNTDGVSHVGIYTGNNNFIHLSSSGVKESSLNENYWENHYLGAKRFNDVKSINSLNENYFTGENAVDFEDNTENSKTFLGVEINEIVNAVIIILFIIGGIVLIGLSIGGM